MLCKMFFLHEKCGKDLLERLALIKASLSKSNQRETFADPKKVVINLRRLQKYFREPVQDDYYYNVNHFSKEKMFYSVDLLPLTTLIELDTYVDALLFNDWNDDVDDEFYKFCQDVSNSYQIHFTEQS